MLHRLDKEQGKKYTFIIKSNWVENVEQKDLILQNDIFVKHNAIINNLQGELIICFDINKIDEFCKKVARETYSEYLDFIVKRDFKKEQWVYNILDGIAEQEKILFRDEQIVIMPTYTWTDHNDLTKMYLLAFPLDKKLHSIRDLDATHIKLLEWIKLKTLETIKSTYGFDSDIIKTYLHYVPSTYHLHIHFVLLSNTDVNSSCEYSYELNTVIENLKINSNYYKLIVMNKRI